MVDFFFYGTLRDADLLATVAGRPLALQPATAPGWRAQPLASAPYPVLVADPEHQAPGVLAANVPAPVAARLDAYEGAEYCRHAIEVRLPDGASRTAQVYVPRTARAPDPGAWDFAAWAEAHGPATRARATTWGARQIAPFTAADVETVAVEAAFRGHFAVDRYHLRHRRYDGAWTPQVSREVFQRGHAVVLLPVDRATGDVVLVEQFRPGAWAAGDPSPWLLEAVAGGIGGDEDAVSAGRRELREETGLEAAGPLRPVLHCYASPGGCSERFDVMVVAVDAPATMGLAGLHEEDEDIRVVRAPLATAMAWVAAGRIRSAPAIIALQWLAANPEGWK